MEWSVKNFPTPYLLAEKFAEDMVGLINESAKRKKPFSVALSGGSTPELLFTRLGDYYSKSIPWEYVRLFWGDERCVTPDDSDSNYGMTKRILIDKIDIPASNIHRIKGEEEPGAEASRYSAEISGCMAERDGFPVFDMVILGLGEDGHTASIFPGHLDLLVSEKICEVAVHPVTNRQRVTLTGKVINNAEVVVFLVTGRKKAAIVEKIIHKSPSSLIFPASYIMPVYGDLTWYIDEEAGSLL